MALIWIVYNTPFADRGNAVDYISEAAVEDAVPPVAEALERMGHEVTVYPLSTITDMCFRLSGPEQPHLILNLAEGYRGNAALEMNVASVYELLGIAYTGNTARTLGIAQDKILTKRLFATEDIPTPAWAVYDGGPVPHEASLRYPAIAKPSREDASLGIGANGVFKDRSELKAGIYNLHKVYGQPILIEEFIDGREFNLSLLQMGNRIEVLPISEICFDDLPPDAPRITSYDAKWLVDSPSFIGTPSVCPAELEEDTAEKLRGIARKVFSLLGGKDYGRVDFRLDASNRPFVLEYNPNPDISPESGFIRSLTASGRSYDDFLRSLLKNNGAENAEAVLS